MAPWRSGGRFPFSGIAYACQFFFGGWFFFHGLNYWFEFYIDRSIEPGPGLVPALAASGVMAVVKVLEVLIGAAFLLNRFAALAVIAAWPITLMIAFVTGSHLHPFGIGVAIVIITINTVLSFGHLDRYRHFLVQHAGPPNLDGLSGLSTDTRTRLPTAVHVGAMLAGLTVAIAITYLSLYLRG